MTRRSRRAAPPTFLRTLALILALATSAPAFAQPHLEDERLFPPDRLDRHVEESDPAGSLLWVAATGEARLDPQGSAIGAGFVLGGSLDAFAAPRAAAVDTAAEAERAAPPREPPVRVDAALARGAVRAALSRDRAAEAEVRLDSMATRSRTSASLPELRLRVMRVVDEDQALAPTEYDPDRTTASGGASTWLEARTTWRLDRWVFAREELAVERLRIARARTRAALERDVLDALARWHRARWRSLDPELPGEKRIEAELEAAAAESSLDVWTEGWFARELARRAR